MDDLAVAIEQDRQQTYCAESIGEEVCRLVDEWEVEIRSSSSSSTPGRCMSVSSAGGLRQDIAAPCRPGKSHAWVGVTREELLERPLERPGIGPYAQKPRLRGFWCFWGLIGRIGERARGVRVRGNQAVLLGYSSFGHRLPSRIATRADSRMTQNLGSSQHAAA